MKFELISVIVPVYKVEEYLDDCVASIVNQTYRNLDIILVDDGSPDKCPEMCDQWAKRDERIRVIHKENGGLSSARNAGLERATGEYIIFVDSDDEISVDCIEKLCAPLSEELYDMVIGNVLTVGDDNVSNYLSLKLADGTILRGKEIEKTYRNKWNMCAWNKLYKSSFIRQQKLSFKEGLVHEDELWSLQIACLAQSLRVVNHVTYIYYVREGSITTAKDKEIRKSLMLKVIVLEISFFLKDRNIISEKAYQLMLKFSWQSLRPSFNDKSKFVRDYCELRKATVMPLLYRVRACGLHPRAQLQNIYYLMPPKLAAHIKYWCYQFKNANI